jgi:3-hydroxymyristoyl/3-hydroxydecanoyl-(acyl carrier protein) dehydratase
MPRLDRLHAGADHAAFAGHFPGYPILPGVVLLDAVLHGLERACGLDLTACRLASAKFLAIVRPGETLDLEYDEPANGAIRFLVNGAGGPVLRGVLELGH